MRLRLPKFLALLATVACAPTQRERPVRAATAAPTAVAAGAPGTRLGDLGGRAPAASELPVGPASRQAKAAAAGLENVVPPEETVVRVLLYHGIGTRTSRPVVKARAFREQLDWLEAHDIEVIRLSQLLDFLDGELWLPRHAAVITIDDGELNGYSKAYPILKERGLPFTLGLATQVIEEHRTRGALNWLQIREMVDSGLCEVASHSVTHRKMTLLPDEVARFELERSRAVLTEELALRPEAFFYPLGDNNYRVRRLTKQSGYRAAFVAHGGPTIAGTQRFGIPRYDVKPDTSMRKFRSFFNHGIPVLRSSR
ncbi:MAG TPA: polysaccharide deacetylase family protein [Polyangiaceae bacterium]